MQSSKARHGACACPRRITAGPIVERILATRSGRRAQRTAERRAGAVLRQSSAAKLKCGPSLCSCLQPRNEYLETLHARAPRTEKGDAGAEGWPGRFREAYPTDFSD